MVFKKYRYKVWIIAASSLQAYFVRLLSHTPHYAIPWRNRKAFQRHLKNGDYMYEFISQDKSFIPKPSTGTTKEDDKPFLAVINIGTDEMDEKMLVHMKAMNRVSSFDLLAANNTDQAVATLGYILDSLRLVILGARKIIVSHYHNHLRGTTMISFGKSLLHIASFLLICATRSLESRK